MELGKEILFLILLFVRSLVSAEFEPILLVHGGAGSISESGIPGKFNGMKEAIRRGYKLLIDNKSSLDAVEAAVRSMEDDPNFNAGYGSVLTANGEVEMDAAIMNGENLQAGCVAIVKDIQNPISLARLVLEKSPHVFLAGNGTKDFAIEQGVEILPPGALVVNRTRESNDNNNNKIIRGQNRPPFVGGQWENSNLDDVAYERGTVGAVAIDIYGNISVATSTGGIRGKRHGRVGDSPILGSGTIANNQIGGVSATGDGEFILRFNLAQEILQRIRYMDMSAQEATEDALNAMGERVGGLAGAITIDHRGDVGLFFISPQMAWAYREGKLLRYGINKGQVIEEEVDDSDGASALQALGIGSAIFPAPFLYRHMYDL